MRRRSQRNEAGWASGELGASEESEGPEEEPGESEESTELVE